MGLFFLKCCPAPIGIIIVEFSHIDGRPRFAKHSIDDINPAINNRNHHAAYAIF
jgi:hypothetical protein